MKNFLAVAAEITTGVHFVGTSVRETLSPPEKAEYIHANPPMTYETRITRLTVLPKGEPIFSEKATHIQIEDEAAGEFISIEQTHDDVALGKIMIDPDEWPAIRDAVDKLLGDCRKDEGNEP